MNYFTNPNNPAEKSQHPYGKEAAKRNRRKIYNSNDNCVTCGDIARYTKNDKCVVCARQEALHFINFITLAGKIAPNDNNDLILSIPKPHSDQLVEYPISNNLMNRIFDAKDLFDYTPTDSPSKAITAGHDFYIHYQSCNVAGHFGIMTVDGECYYCQKEKDSPSPRKQALADGESWYTPSNPCKRCGTLAERSVHNGQCKGCSDLGDIDSRETPDSLMMRESPDLILSKADARTYGFKVYRTGKQCRRGHTGYRYVSTGSCIECLRD